MASTIGAINPYRYKSYYFDTETNLYYLQSRYYDAGVQRFISPDDTEFLGADRKIYSCNLYCYCGNDPINYKDESGHFVIAIGAGSTISIGTAIVLIGLTVFLFAYTFDKKCSKPIGNNDCWRCC